MTKTPARIAAAFLFSGLLLALRPAAAQNAPAPAPAPSDPKARIAETSGIITQGHAELHLKPERAFVTLAVLSEGPTLVRAAEENRALVQRVVGALGGVGVAARQIAVRVGADEVGGSGGGFGGGGFAGGGNENPPARQASTLRFAIARPGDLDKILTAAAKAGANGNVSVRYELRDPRAARNAALKAAVADALAKADVMAAAARVGPVRLAALTENSAYPPQPNTSGLNFGWFREALADVPAGSTVSLWVSGAGPDNNRITAIAMVTARFTLSGPRPTPPNRNGR